MAHCISCTTNQCVIVATCTNIDFFAFLVLTYTMPHCIMSSSQEHDNQTTGGKHNERLYKIYEMGGCLFRRPQHPGR